MIETGVSELFLSIRGPMLTEFFLSLTSLGSIVFGAVLCTGLWFLSRGDAVRTFVGLTASYLTTHALKLVFQVPRPPTETMLASVSTYSFPSGHATVAFSLAFFLSEMRTDLKPYLYSIAALVAVSRLYLGVHFLMDVIAGAFVGYIVSKAIAQKISSQEVERSLEKVISLR